MIDVGNSTDETSRFQVAGGRVNLLARLGIDPETTSKLLCIGARHIARGPDGINGEIHASSGAPPPHHADVRRLTALDQVTLWSAAGELHQSAVALERARNDLPGRSAEEAQAFGRLVEAHDANSSTLAFHRPIQRFGLMLVGACLSVGLILLVADQQIGDNGFTGRVLVALGLLAAAVTAYDYRRVRRIRADERALLAPSGVTRFDELVSHVGPLAQSWRRQALIEATAAHERAQARWRDLTGGIELEWVLAHRATIESIASDKARFRLLDAEHLVSDPSATADSARMLVDRIIELQEVGVTKQRLPLLLDEPFSGFAPVEVERLLYTVHRLAAHHQILLVTGDPYIQAWATGSAAASSVSFVRLGHVSTATTTVDAEPARRPSTRMAGRRTRRRTVRSTTTRPKSAWSIRTANPAAAQRAPYRPPRAGPQGVKYAQRLRGATSRGVLVPGHRERGASPRRTASRRAPRWHFDQ